MREVGNLRELNVGLTRQSNLHNISAARAEEKVEALRAELDALREQKPVAWMNSKRDMTYLSRYNEDDVPLYAAPVPNRHDDINVADCDQVVDKSDGWNDCVAAMKEME